MAGEKRALKQYPWALRVIETDDGRRFMSPREEWGEGPWQDEPDFIEWRDPSGLPCLIVRSGSGGLCGYVGLPPPHPDFARPYQSIEEEASHGGLTYSGYCGGSIHYRPQDGETSLVWWIGFDCAHSGDLAPAMEALARPFRQLAVERWAHLHDAALRALLEGTYKHVEYVRVHVECLAVEMASRTRVRLATERWWWWHLAQAKQFLRQDLPAMWKTLFLEQTRYGWRQDEWEQLPWNRGSEQ